MKKSMVLLLVWWIGSGIAFTLPASAENPITEFAHIVQFLPPNSEKTLNYSMDRNEVYSFYFKPETTYILFNLQITITSPSGQSYNILNFTDDCRLNITEHRTWFTSYESGYHQIKITVQTNRVMNLKLRITRESSIREYYINSIMPDLSKNNVSLTSFYNTTVNFNTMEKIHNLTVDMIADKEYTFDFFRANPITNEEILAKDYVYPRITVWLRIGNVRYLQYDNLLLLNHSYATNRSFTVPFGAHNSSANVFDLEMQPSIISLNMIFVCYSVDTVTENSSAMTNPPKNNTESYQWNGSMIDTWESELFGFIDHNKDTLILSTGAGIIILSAINYYRTKKKPKQVESADNRE